MEKYDTSIMIIPAVILVCLKWFYCKKIFIKNLILISGACVYRHNYTYIRDWSRTQETNLSTAKQANADVWGGGGIVLIAVILINWNRLVLTR